MSSLFPSHPLPGIRLSHPRAIESGHRDHSTLHVSRSSPRMLCRNCPVPVYLRNRLIFVQYSTHLYPHAYAHTLLATTHTHLSDRLFFYCLAISYCLRCRNISHLLTLLITDFSNRRLMYPFPSPILLFIQKKTLEPTQCTSRICSSVPLRKLV